MTTTNNGSVQSEGDERRSLPSFHSRHSDGRFSAVTDTRGTICSVDEKDLEDIALHSEDNDVTAVEGEESKFRCCSSTSADYWRYINLVSLFDMLTLPRFILLPALILSIVGGPAYLVFPWALWALTHFVVYALQLHTNPSEAPSLLRSLPYCDKEVLDRFCFSHQATNIMVIVWSVVDGLMSIGCVVISVLLVIVCYIEPDGRIVKGGHVEYNVLLAACIFSGISCLLRIVVIILCSIHLCKGAAPAPAPTDTSSILFRIMHPKSRLSLLIASLIISFTALICVTITLHLFLHSNYYEAEDTASYSGCDPMVAKACTLPYPSNHFLTPDSSTATGYRVNMKHNTLPFTKRGQHISPHIINTYDGFSVSAPILWHIKGVRNEELIPLTDVPRSLHWNCTTLLVNTNDFTLHTHFTEKDYLDYNSNRMSYIMPSRAMHYNTTYLAVVQSLTNAKGELLKPSSLMQSYLDAYVSGSSAYDSDDRYVRFRDVYFPQLQSEGVNISSIQLMWDFHTASQESLLNLITSVNASTRHIMGQIAPTKPYKRLTLTHNECSKLGNGHDQGKMVSVAYYRIEAPLYLQNQGRQDNVLVDKYLHLTGDPTIDGVKIPMAKSAGLMIQIPCSIYNGDANVTAIMENGHGLFGSRSNANDRWVRRQAYSQGWIVWSMDWRGFSRYDLPEVARMLLYDLNAVNTIESAVVQGFSNKLAGQLIVRNILLNQAKALRIDHIPSSVIEALPHTYYGLSLGGCMGAGWTAYAGHHRAVLIAGGSSFTFLLGRADIFGLYVRMIGMQFYSRADMRIMLSLVQSKFDSMESSGWAHSGRYDNAQILAQNGDGDSTIAAVAGRILAANINATVIQHTQIDITGQPNVVAPIDAPTKAYMEVLYKKDSNSLPEGSRIPNHSTYVHLCIALENDIQQQNMQFIANGTVINPCDEDECIHKHRLECDYA